MNVNTPKRFDSKIEDLGEFFPNINNLEHSVEKIVKNEPMFFNCDLLYAYDFGGLITKNFIDSLPEEWKTPETVFDSRVHMLMKDWYPCIPGWHHDDVGRTKEKNGQPDYDNLQYESEHILGLINADICPTMFALGNTVFSPVEDGVNIYEQWDKEVNNQIDRGLLEVFECPDNKLIKMNYQTWHQGQKAKNNGWRWFGRVSRNTERSKNITNEIRVNAQVYLDIPKKGW